jgi:hypothetical protein
MRKLVVSAVALATMLGVALSSAQAGGCSRARDRLRDRLQESTQDWTKDGQNECAQDQVTQESLNGTSGSECPSDYPTCDGESSQDSYQGCDYPRDGYKKGSRKSSRFRCKGPVDGETWVRLMFGWVPGSSQ